LRDSIHNLGPGLAECTLAFLGLGPGVECRGFASREAVHKRLDNVLNKAIHGIGAPLLGFAVSLHLQRALILREELEDRADRARDKLPKPHEIRKVLDEYRYAKSSASEDSVSLH
jgi:hypothetical protein